MEDGVELTPLEESTVTSQGYMSLEQNGNGSPHSEVQKRGKEAADEDIHSLNMEERAYYRFCALLIAWLSIILLVILAVFSFTASKVTGSSAAFGFGFDCILDIGTSLVVVWRFIGPVGNIYSEEKERMALNLLGGFFILAFLAIVIRSIPELVNGTVPEDSNWVLIMASVSSLLCYCLAFSKFYLASKLDSWTIQSDGYSSLAGAITSMTWVMSAFIIKENHDLWYIDDVVGLCVALLLLYYGISLLCRNLPSASSPEYCKQEDPP